LPPNKPATAPDPKSDLQRFGGGRLKATLLGHSASHLERLFLPDTVEKRQGYWL